MKRENIAGIARYHARKHMLIVHHRESIDCVINQSPRLPAGDVENSILHRIHLQRTKCNHRKASRHIPNKHLPRRLDINAWPRAACHFHENITQAVRTWHQIGRRPSKADTISSLTTSAPLQIQLSPQQLSEASHAQLTAGYIFPIKETTAFVNLTPNRANFIGNPSTRILISHHELQISALLTSTNSFQTPSDETGTLETRRSVIGMNANSTNSIDNAIIDWIPTSTT